MTSLRILILCLIGTLLAACAGPTPKGMAGTPFVASPNFDERRPNIVVLHHTGGNTQQGALNTLTSSARQVSAHYLIGRQGDIVQLVDERQRAWHAGASWWNGQNDINSNSIGIELDNNGTEPFSEPQIQALLRLLADLQARYRLPGANFVGHADVAPGRKVDPSPWFPWSRLAQQGFGLWCDLPQPDAPVGFELNTGLMALGYDPRVPDKSQQAFLLHFAAGKPLDIRQQKALAYCLLQQKKVLALMSQGLSFTG